MCGLQGRFFLQNETIFLREEQQSDSCQRPFRIASQRPQEQPMNNEFLCAFEFARDTWTSDVLGSSRPSCPIEGISMCDMCCSSLRELSWKHEIDGLRRASRAVIRRLQLKAWNRTCDRATIQDAPQMRGEKDNGY